MDLNHIARVIWRFRGMLVGGVILACLLAAATVFKVSLAGGSPKLEYRSPEIWVSYGRLLVTQSGFPQGRSDLGGDAPVAGEAVPGDPAQQFADPARFVEMATLYARLATTEPVRRLVFEDGRVAGADSIVVTAQENQPLIEVSATAESRAGAIMLAQRQVDALRTYIAREQRDNGIAAPNRISLTVVERPGAPAVLPEQVNTWVIAPRSPIKPALVFLTACGLFFALALVLENANPRLRAVRDEPALGPTATQAQPHEKAPIRSA